MGEETMPGVVLIGLGCHNKIYKQDGLNSRNLFLTVLETEKSRIKMPADLAPGEGSLPGLEMV
jgi:hypothetical protein